MHEYSIVQSLMEQIALQAGRHGASAVHRVRLRIGELAGIDPDLLRTAYEMVREGTICEAAPLDIDTVEARWECRGCGRVIVAGSLLQCEACGRPARLAAGDEILLERLELEVEDV
jgi:hydrogenase nickel incorporation protein HypA/HybF